MKLRSIIIKKIKKQNPKLKICKIQTLDFGALDVYIKNNSFTIDQSELSEKEWNIQKKEGNDLINKIRNAGLPVEEYVNAKINYGIKTGFNEAFILAEKKKTELINQDSNNADLIKPVLSGAESKRYSIRSKANYIIFTRRGIDILQYPSILKHLESFKTELTPKTNKDQQIGRKPGKYKWYEIQDTVDYYKEFEKPKIVWGNLSTKASFSLDEDIGYYINAPACILPTDSKYVLGILNSKVMSYFLRSICAERQGGFIEQKPVYVSQVPIKAPTKTQETAIISFVNKMLQLNAKLVALGNKLTDERAQLEKEIAEIDAKIDAAVYEIYELTPEERTIVEQNSS